MNLFIMVFCMVLATSPLALAESSNAEALRLCVNIHHMDIHNMKHPHAAFSNNHCFLTCYDGSRTLSSTPINDGFICPENPSAGICRNGACVDEKADAISQCSTIHKTDFSKINSTGTAFVNDHCALRCVVGGIALSMNHLNEGRICEQNFDGVSFGCKLNLFL